MKKSILFAAFAAATLAPTLAAMADNRPVRMIGSSVRAVAVSPALSAAMVSIGFNCEVSGTPVEFPNDIRISRVAGATSAGTQVAYSVPGGHTGLVTLPAMAPGQFYHVANAVPGGLPAGTLCSASLN